MNVDAQKTRFVEGSNVATIIAAPVAFALILYFYQPIANFVRPLGIKTDEVFSYTFNLFAIEIGALLALFALFACRPTPFLERIKSTAAFGAIVANTNITLVATCIALGATFVFGLLHVAPTDSISAATVIYVGWCCLVTATTVVYVRTIRLILTALS